MLSWHKVSLILHREVRDQLRDRRTLFMIAVLPLLLYPALGIGMMQLTVLFSEQPRTVVLLGSADLPKTPQLLEGKHFVTSWFDLPSSAEKLEVITDADVPATPEHEVDRATTERNLALLQTARNIRDELQQQKILEEELGAKQSALDIAQKIRRLQQSRETLGTLFARSRIQVLILIPSGFGTHLERVNEQLAGHAREIAEVTYPRPEVVYNKADDKSQITYNRVREAMESWEAAILKQRLEIAQLPQEFTQPVHPMSTNLALDEQIAANLWGKLFPALLVIMALTGAFYPAIDLCAGEKERGTMETLLICPATRTEIVLGKFLTVMLFSCMTAILNLISMGMTGRHVVSMSAGTAFAHAGTPAFPSFGGLMWIGILLIPLAALFSALCLALATFARSSKEGQYYLTPLLLVTLGLTMFCLSPGVELTPLYSVMPVAGVALLLKGLLLSPLHAGSLYLYAIPVLLTSVGYSALALWWAIEQFNREEVLFREAERFELALWIRHLLRDKEPTPSFTEAGFCFILIMFLQFAAMRAFAAASVASGPGPGSATAAMKVLLIQQLAIVASPALFMGIMLTTSVCRTFRLRIPDWHVLATALVLPCVLHPLTVEMAANLQWFFPPLPESIAGVLRSMADPTQPLWFVLLAFALAPAICEEVAFRGFILSGFNRSGRTWLAIGLSSVAFGVMHMIPQQVFNASILGVVLGMLAIRGNSLIPCFVFHLIYNTLGVMHGRIQGEHDNLLFAFPEGQLRYRWPLLLICAAIAVPLLRWVARFQGDHADSDSPQIDSSQIGSTQSGYPASAARPLEMLPPESNSGQMALSHAAVPRAGNAPLP